MSSRLLPWTFKHLVNPLTIRLLRSPAGGRLGEVLLLLTYTGRKSGRKITTPVSYTREGSVITLFADGSWANNFISPAPVEMLVRGERLTGTARTYTDPQVIAEAVRREIETHGRMAARRHPKGADLKRKLVRIELD